MNEIPGLESWTRADINSGINLRVLKSVLGDYHPFLPSPSYQQDIQADSKLTGDFPFPIIADNRELAVKFGMLDPDEKDKAGLPLTARCVS